MKREKERAKIACRERVRVVVAKVIKDVPK